MKKTACQITACQTHLGFSILVAAILMFFSANVWAGGGQHYPNGSTDFVVGALPPAGTYLENHLVYTHKDRLVDNSGKKVPVDLSVDVIVEAARFVHVTPYSLFGASWGMQVIVPVYHTDFELTTPGPSIDSDDTNVGDITFSPLVLGWHHGPNFHQVFALDIIAPTGNYDSHDPATQILSRNHWSMEPALATTYLWKGFDFSTKLMYDFHTENDDFIDHTGQKTDLKPGDEFHFDWALGYSPKPGLRLGLVGYNHWQVSDDEVGEKKVRDERSRIGAVGPGIKYWPEHGPFSATLKYYVEYGARNIAEGQAAHLKINYKF